MGWWWLPGTAFAILVAPVAGTAAAAAWVEVTGSEEPWFVLAVGLPVVLAWIVARAAGGHRLAAATLAFAAFAASGALQVVLWSGVR